MTVATMCDVAEEVRKIGATAAFVRMRGVSNRASDAEFAALRDQVVAGVLGTLSAEAIATDPVLLGYRLLHDAVGRSNKKNVAFHRSAGEAAAGDRTLSPGEPARRLLQPGGAQHARVAGGARRGPRGRRHPPATSPMAASISSPSMPRNPNR